MTEKYINETVLKIVKQQFSDNLNVLIFEDTNLDEIRADSLDRINIAISLEEEFSIDIKDEDAEKWVTVKDIIEYIEKII